MYLFFDTSANGKPKSYKASPNDPFNWPRMVHLSWLLYDENRELIDSRNDVIKPVGFNIEETTLKTSKLTREQLENGVDLKEALTAFADVVKKATYITTYNMNLQRGIVSAELHRKSITHFIEQSDLYCLMQEATWFCKIPAKSGKKYKWPPLQEIHSKLHGAWYANAGDAQTDVATISICTFNLVDIDAFEFF